MKNLPKSNEFFSNIDHRPPKETDWMETPIDIRKGMYCYAANPKSVDYLSLPYAREWNPLEDDWKLPENWQQIIHEGFREQVSQLQGIHGYLCALRGLCRQMSLFYRHRGPQEHAGAAGRTAAIRLSK